ncbi:MAG: helix-turn-helix domain-containing protein [Pseudomonadota bacterium]
MAEDNTARKRRPQERAELTKKKLLQVAIKEFSERGFDAVTVRDIEVQAGVQRNLVSYHFGSKDDIWKAAAVHLLAELADFNDARRELMQDLSAHERVAYTIRSYVRFCAKHPEFNRLMIQEGKQDSWRVRWLADNYIRPGMERLRKRVMEDLDLKSKEFVHWYYLFVSGGAMLFAMAPEVDALFGVNLDDEEVINRHANMMVDFLLSRSAG